MPRSDDAVVGARLDWVDTITRRHRLVVNVVVHTVLFSLSLLLAYMVRFEIAEPKTRWFLGSFLPWLPVFVIPKLIIFGRFGLFRGGWQYASTRDIYNILGASWVFCLVFWIMIAVSRWVGAVSQTPTPVEPEQIGYWSGMLRDYFSKYPQGVLFLDFLASVFLVCTARLGYRLYREERRPVSPEGVRKVLIVGAGNAAESIIREIYRMPVDRYRVVGLVDDDPLKRGIAIHGVRVMGATDDLPRICQDQEVEEIIITMPSATQKQLRRVIDLCSGTKLKFQSLPSLGDLVNGKVTVSQIRPVDINDLLGRKAVELDTAAVESFIQGRRVLITGAGGSIGSEMCRQVCRFNPSALLLVEQAENPLFEIENELRGAYPDLPIIGCICDITDRQRVTRLWEMHRPDVVIHAAAHKHVPLMERDPCEAIKNNILGTRCVADASCAYGVSEFVTISTDKAVNPSSVMGATKRVAEIYTQALNGRPGCKTQFKAVRFGNVLGSAGSVVPTFRKQIAAGGPVKVTHPEMTRYFMTIPEASQLVLQAAATGGGGQIYLLDMGEPVKIIDLARQMITLSGFRPGEDIDIEITGIRPGEKLFEELRTEGEDIQPTVHPKVSVWRCRRLQWEQIEVVMEDLAQLTNSTDRQQIIQVIRRLVPEYQPDSPATAAPKASESARPLRVSPPT